MQQFDIPSGVVITIGRQYGSGGRDLGKRLAEAFGIKFYDKALFNEAAKKAGMNPSFFEKNDERFPKFVSGIFSFTMGYHSLNPFTGGSSISDDSIYRAQSDFIAEKAAEESCVIVGRTSDYVLRDHPRCVNIFVHAPMEHCIDRIVARDTTMDREKARNQALKVNRQRAEYYNFYTDKTWGASESYDLSIDTSKMSMESIVELVAHYLRLRFS